MNKCIVAINFLLTLRSGLCYDLQIGNASYWCEGCGGPLFANTLLSYQRDQGGWPKNIHPIAGENYTGSEIYGSLDNGATVNEVRFMAQAWKETSIIEYRDSAQAGLNMIFDAQYDNGGWPQYWPLKPEGAYANAVTFNDNLHKNVLELLDEVVASVNPFDIAPFNAEIRAVTAVASGIQVLLDSQIIVEDPSGVCPNRTNWCAQHDQTTLEPVAARSHEPASFSGNEGMRLAQYLMTLDSPSQTAKEAIVGAYIWAKKATLHNYYKSLDGNGSKILVYEKGAKLWPRFATIPNSTVIFCDRGCTTNSSLMYHDWPNGYFEFEDPGTRDGYTWLGNWGDTVIDIFETQWIGQHSTTGILNPLCLYPNGCIPIDNWSDLEAALSMAQSTVTLCAPFSIETDGADARISSPKEVICKKNDPSQECEIFGTSSHIYIISGEVKLQGFTFRGSQASAIRTSSNLQNIRIYNCTFENNHMTTTSGGAIDTSSGVTLEIVNSSFINNSAVASGGAIYTQYSNVTVRYSYFESNSAAQGGSIIMLGSSSDQVYLHVEGSTFVNNSATEYGPIISIRFGEWFNGEDNEASGSIVNALPGCEGVYLSAGSGECAPFNPSSCISIYSWSDFESALSTSQPTVTLCAPFSVETDGSDARISSPLQVYCQKTDPSQECEIVGTSSHLYIISGNVILDGFTFRGSQDSAIRTSSYLQNIKIANCIFENNHRSSHGGAIRTSSGVTLEIVNSSFISNSASGNNGGAIYTQYSNVSVMDSYFESNVANQGGSIILLGSTADKVYLYVEGSSFANNNATGYGPVIGLREGDFTDGGGNTASGNLLSGLSGCNGVYFTADATCFSFPAIPAIPGPPPQPSNNAFDWDINPLGEGVVSFSDATASEEIIMQFNVSDHPYRVIVFKHDCATLVTGNVLSLTTEDGTSDSGTNKIVTAKIDVDQHTMQNENNDIWTETPDGREGRISFCLRLDLYTDDTKMNSVNFHETNVTVTVDMSEGFDLTSVSSARTEAQNIDENSTVSYSLQAYQCNSNGDEIDNILSQGSELTVCVGVNSPGITIGDIMSFSLTQGGLNGGSTTPIAEGIGANDLTAYGCFYRNGTQCRIRTMLISSFFTQTNSEDIVGSGKAVMAFGSNRRKLQERILQQTTDKEFTLRIAIVHHQTAPTSLPKESTGIEAGLVAGIATVFVFVATITSFFIWKKVHVLRSRDHHTSSLLLEDTNQVLQSVIT